MQIPRDDPNYAPQYRPEPKSGGSIKTILLVLLIAVAVSWTMATLWIMPAMVSKADFTTNIQSMQGKIDTLKSQMDANGAAVATAASTQAKQGNDIQTLKEGIKDYVTVDQLKGYALKTDIPKAIDTSSFAAKSDLSGLATKDQIDALQKQIDALKTSGSAGGSGGTGGMAGQVVVAIDQSTPTQFNGASPYTVKININNGTNSYQYVSFFTNVSLVTPSTIIISGATMAVGTTNYNPIYVPVLGITTQNQQIIFTPPAKLLVPPGITSSYYLVTINPSQAAVWSVGISNIVSSSTP